ncbi:major tail protein [Bacillus smithii]|uniref:major tail protein n=1 Tax=Bacillus smithii TaxID=1479 RepID=UPI0030C8F6F5
MSASGIVGLKDLYIAEVTKDDATGMTFSTPEKLAPGLEAKITNNVDSQVIYADDVPVEVATTQGEIKVEINVSDLEPAKYARLLGKTKNADGAVADKLDDVPPYFALMFRSKKANGAYRYMVLYKGRFTPGDEDYKTQQGKADVQNSSVTGTFIKPEGRDEIRYIMDSDDEDANPTVIANWFTQVYQPTGGTTGS